MWKPSSDNIMEEKKPTVLQTVVLFLLVSIFCVLNILKQVRYAHMLFPIIFIKDKKQAIFQTVVFILVVSIFGVLNILKHVWYSTDDLN